LRVQNQQFGGSSLGVGSYPPRNLINPGNDFQNPFGQEEYVGPNSQVFQNIYEQGRPYPNSMRLPPGARYDPIDPFDNPLSQKG